MSDANIQILGYTLTALIMFAVFSFVNRKSNNNKGNVDLEHTAEAIAGALIYDVLEFFPRVEKNLRDVGKSTGLPNEFSEKDKIELAIYVLFSELEIAKNIFKEDFIINLDNVSFARFSEKTNYNRVLLNERILKYREVFRSDIKAGINPMGISGVLKILAENMNIKKTPIKLADTIIENIDAYIIQVLAIWVTTDLIGRWKTAIEKEIKLQQFLK